MTWSQTVLHSIESVLRYYEFADHVAERIADEVAGHGWGKSASYGTASGLAAGVQPWTLWFAEPTTGGFMESGTPKPFAAEPQPGSVLSTKALLVFVGHWPHRLRPGKMDYVPPQVVVGGGTLVFSWWAKSADVKWYLKGLGDELNAKRSGGEGAVTAITQVRNLRLTDFKWLAPQELGSLDTADKLADFADRASLLAEECIG